MNRATSSTSSCPATSPVIATTMGSPAATSDPKAMSRMMMATSRPIASDESGPAPAPSSAAPDTPTVRVSVAALIATSTNSVASAVEGAVPDSVTVA
jgi:hypothetical protein